MSDCRDNARPEADLERTPQRVLKLFREHARPAYTGLGSYPRTSPPSAAERAAQALLRAYTARSPRFETR
jgi:hypothetical protein